MSEVRSLRAYAEVDLGRQRSPHHDDGPFMTRYLRAANVKDGQLELTDVKEMNFQPAEQRHFSLRAGDILVTEGSGSLTSVGASAVWNGELHGTVCFQNTLLRLRPRSSTDGRFLAWWCRHAFADGLFASISTGANIFHLSAERVRSLPMTYVALDRQRTIAEFLDTETARIDALIAKRRRMIEVLDEKVVSASRAALLGHHEAGNRVSTPDPWAPEIPSHWDYAPVYSRFDVLLGRMLNAERSAGGDMRPYLRNVNVRWGAIDTTDVASMDFPSAERRRYRLRVGDLLVCEGGAGVARAAVWDGQLEECYFQKSLHRIRPASDWPVEWLIEWLRVSKYMGVFLAEGNLATIPHLTFERLRVYRVPFPPADACREMLRTLAEVHRDIRQTGELLARQISLLQEHRQALITAAVTGEMEVPGMAA